MAALSGQNIGLNFKGIINLGSTINSPLSGTLQAITDGDGVASPLRLSTTQVAIQSLITVGTGASWGVYANTSLDATGFFVQNRNSLGTPVWSLRDYTNSGFTFFSKIDFLVDSTQAGSWNTTGLGIGTSSPSARLHVRGDGTNPIARFEASGGLRSLAIESSGDLIRYGTGDAGMYILNQSGSSSISGQAIGWQTALSSFAGHGFRIFNVYDQTYTSGTGGLLDIGALGGTFAAGAGSANFRPLSIAYTINNSGAQTGTATGIFLNATETALNGMGHNLMDLQVGGSSRFRVTNTGITSTSTLLLSSRLAFSSTDFGFLELFSAGVWTFNGGGINSTPRINLGGFSNAFPAIKRNGAAIDFRLADDSAYCRVDIGSGSRSYGEYRFCDPVGNNAAIFYGQGLANGLRTFWMNNGQILFSGNPSGGLVSAAIQIDSTTQGFLPPRMTTAQRDLIGTPAAGLMIYNTSTNRPNFYDGSAWVAL
jgi:hypothetical protein